MKNFTTVGFGQHMIAVTSTDTPGWVFKIPRDPNLMSNRLKAHYDFFGRQLQRRRRSGQSILTSILLSQRDVILNREKFWKMEGFISCLSILKKIKYIEECAEYLPKFEIINEFTMTCLDEKKHKYFGPCIKQEFSRKFVQKENITIDDLHNYLKSGLNLHLSLWKAGFGIAANRETWAPINWGYGTTSRLMLFDFSSLTQNYSLIERNLEELSKTQALNNLADTLGKEISQTHIDNVALILNKTTLKKYWSSDVG